MSMQWIVAMGNSFLLDDYATYFFDQTNFQGADWNREETAFGSSAIIHLSKFNPL